MACVVCKKQYVHSTEVTAFDSDEKPHVCVICGKSFSLKIQLKKHMENHEGGKPYICHSCEKKDSLSYNLRLQKKGNFICSHCNKTFESKRMLLQHASEHDLVECEESFKNVTESKKHSASHKSLKSSNKKQKVNNEKFYQCNECERVFTQLSALTKHHSLSHAQYQCDLCKTKFSLKQDLDDHCINGCQSKTASDNEVKKYFCSLCQKTFMRKTALEGHLMSHLNEKSESAPEDDSDADADFSCNLPGEKNNNQPKEMCLPKLKLRRSYPCEICKKVCASEVLLEKHMLYHKKTEKDFACSTKKKYRCRTCREVFSSKIDYKKHKLNHSSKDKSESEVKKIKTYMCEICLIDFSKKKHLKKHIKTHSSTAESHDTNSNECQRKKPKRSKDFPCQTCGKLFAGRTCLRKHELRHKYDNFDPLKMKKSRSPVNLICPFCNEDFTGRKFHFMRHKLTHTPEVCGICDERFVDRAALREHLKTHIGTEEARKFLECSQKAQTLKTNLQSTEAKVEYIYLVLR